MVVGFYSYVRNPMYFGFAAGWIGLWVVFGHPNPVAIAGKNDHSTPFKACPTVFPPISAQVVECCPRGVVYGRDS